MSAMEATVISTGEELISGQTADTNAAFLAERLTSHGFQVRRLLALGDDPDALQEELLRAAADCALVLITGGLGPTADDRTRLAITRAVGLELVQDDDSLDHVRRLVQSHGRELTDAHVRQAQFPAGSHIFPNQRGTAPGFACNVGEATVVAMPGVPDEMRAMFERSVLPYLAKGCSQKVVVRSANLFGLPESLVDGQIADLMQEDRNPSVGLKVEGGIVRICLRARSANAGEAETLAERDLETIRERFGDGVFGCDETSLAAALGRLLERQGLKIAVAESCTGGLIGGMLTDVPGISSVFLLDVVAYSNESKVRELRIPPDEIESHGAVSPQVAASMARGVCEISGAGVGLSTTGIAGPTGGSPQKPVGLVYVGLCVDGETEVHKLKLRGDRWRIRDRAAKSALNFARLALLHRGRQG